jgi:hypothetical protein
MMEDEQGLTRRSFVPVDELRPFHTGVRSYQDLPPILCDQIAHFFRHYKDLEAGKWDMQDRHRFLAISIEAERLRRIALEGVLVQVDTRVQQQINFEPAKEHNSP